MEIVALGLGAYLLHKLKKSKVAPAPEEPRDNVDDFYEAIHDMLEDDELRKLADMLTGLADEREAKPEIIPIPINAPNLLLNAEGVERTLAQVHADDLAIAEMEGEADKAFTQIIQIANDPIPEDIPTEPPTEQPTTDIMPVPE